MIDVIPIRIEAEEKLTCRITPTMMKFPCHPHHRPCPNPTTMDPPMDNPTILLLLRIMRLPTIPRPRTTTPILIPLFGIMPVFGRKCP